MLNTVTRAIRELFAHETTLYNELSRKSTNEHQTHLPFKKFSDSKSCSHIAVRETWCLFPDRSAKS